MTLYKIRLFNILISLATICWTITCFSQESHNNRTERKHALSFKTGGDLSLAGLSYDVFETPKFNWEFNLSFFLPGFGGGFYYHPFGNRLDKKWSPYTGIHVANNFLPSFLWDGNYPLPAASAYIPFGNHYVSDKGFNFSFDVGLIFDNVSFNGKHVDPFASIKVGHRFINRKSKNKKRINLKDNSDSALAIREKKKIGVSIMAKMPYHLLAINLDYFVIPKLNVEVFGSIIEKGFGAACYYHPLGSVNKLSLSPYLGVGYGLIIEYDREHFYLPVGISYINNLGIFVNLDVGYSYVDVFYIETGVEQKVWVFGSSLKAGYRF